MAAKSPNERIEALTEKVRQLELTFEQHRVVTNLRVDNLEASAAEHERTEEELRNKVADLTAKNAALEERVRSQEKNWEERARTLEKTADRGWQLWLAALGFGFGLFSLLITAALQLKK